MTTVSRTGTSAPAETLARTGAVPSVFITTIVQSPSSASQVTTCLPLPCAVAAQKVSSAGRSVGVPPSTYVVSGRPWSPDGSVTVVCATPWR